MAPVPRFDEGAADSQPAFAFAGTAMVVVASAAQASTPEAWEAYGQQALAGTYPQAPLAGRRGLELCVYDSRSRRRSVRLGEADRLIRKH